ncbi:MAG: hypothetical protein WBA67_05730, partial [Jannaschia sp.]
MLHDILKEKRLRRQVLLLNYDTMYDDLDTTERGLLQHLGIPPDPQFRAVLHAHADFASNRGAKKVPGKFVEPFSAIDMGPVRGLRKVAREQIQTLAAAYDARETSTK